MGQEPTQVWSELNPQLMKVNMASLHPYDGSNKLTPDQGKYAPQAMAKSQTRQWPEFDVREMLTNGCGVFSFCWKKLSKKSKNSLEFLKKLVTKMIYQITCPSYFTKVFIFYQLLVF